MRLTGAAAEARGAAASVARARRPHRRSGALHRRTAGQGDRSPTAAAQSRPRAGADEATHVAEKFPGVAERQSDHRRGPPRFAVYSPDGAAAAAAAAKSLRFEEVRGRPSADAVEVTSETGNFADPTRLHYRPLIIL